MKIPTLQQSTVCIRERLILGAANAASLCGMSHVRPVFLSMSSSYRAHHPDHDADSSTGCGGACRPPKSPPNQPRRRGGCPAPRCTLAGADMAPVGSGGLTGVVCADAVGTRAGPCWPLPSGSRWPAVEPAPDASPAAGPPDAALRTKLFAPLCAAIGGLPCGSPSRWLASAGASGKVM